MRVCCWKKYEKNTFFASLKSLKKGVVSGFGSVSQGYGSADPDPHPNVTDPQHCLQFAFLESLVLSGSKSHDGNNTRRNLYLSDCKTEPK
jgi:hypothetical protein